MRQFILFVIGLALISCDEESTKKDYLNLKQKLSGQWKAKAFDGELHEAWTLGDEGWMEQEGYYIENSDTLYEAKTMIQKINEDIILLSVIKNSNPKIFKAISRTETSIIFENDDYKNPFEVKYEFLSDQNYRRTIKGYENDSIISYEFNFKKVN